VFIFACTDSWSNAAGGDWLTDGNWSNGVPTASDRACITLDGTYTVTMSSSASPYSLLIGGSSGTQTLSLAATSSANSSLQATAAVTIGAHAVVDLVSTSGTNDSLLQAPTITNDGALAVDPGTGGARYLRGSVVNNGSVSIDTNTSDDQTEAAYTNNGTTSIASGASLQLSGASGNYTQTSNGRFTTSIDASGDPGELTATGSLTLNGTLAISRAKAYQPTSGTFPLLSGASLSGAFSKETGAVINGSSYFLPTYSSTAASITVTTAAISLTASSGPAGTSFTMNGLGYPPADTVAITFKDKAGTTTILATPTTDGAGTFSQSVTIPPGAAAGKGKLAAKSKFAGVSASQSFTVT
jgi:hypothetical protein